MVYSLQTSGQIWTSHIINMWYVYHVLQNCKLNSRKLGIWRRQSHTSRQLRSLTDSEWGIDLCCGSSDTRPAGSRASADSWCHAGTNAQAASPSHAYVWQWSTWTMSRWVLEACWRTLPVPHLPTAAGRSRQGHPRCTRSQSMMMTKLASEIQKTCKRSAAKTTPSSIKQV